MDLREFNTNEDHVAAGVDVLNYQPFILSDDVQTGVGYSWRNRSDPRFPTGFVFHREQRQEQWNDITEANAMLRRTYDGLIRFIAERFPGKTLLDVACNNGYFPVRAELYGMAPSFGMDMGSQHSYAIEFLNGTCGTHATFLHASYDPISHTAPVEGKYDVVVASAIMCHLPDPLNFLAFLASKAREAVFFWGQVIDTDNLLVCYSPPHQNLHDRPFPYCFNDNTRISRGLMELSFKQLGFKEVVEAPWQDNWISPYITRYTPASLEPRAAPKLKGRIARKVALKLLGPGAKRAMQGFNLIDDIEISSKHVGILAIR
ncbi:MAG TPA: methyltransferase domain-containing protein [Pirellulales bacterium]|jgi:SAM-dependent methyltransferase|nr:methyltransferase domain-containing protein [Pirellulales bacterium]